MRGRAGLAPTLTIPFRRRDATAADLRAAARDGDVARVRELLAAGVEVDARSRYGRSCRRWTKASIYRRGWSSILPPGSGADRPTTSVKSRWTPIPSAIMLPVPPRAVGLASTFSYKINPQTVLFPGYSDNHLPDEELHLTQTDRTVFFKVGYAWVM